MLLILVSTSAHMELRAHLHNTVCVDAITCGPLQHVYLRTSALETKLGHTSSAEITDLYYEMH
jgi:hypothetical protein